MLQAEYFDGRSTRGQSVRVSRLGDLICLRGDNLDKKFPFSEISVGERLGAAPRMIALPDGAHIEAADHQAFEAWLAESGLSESSVDLAQRSWLVAAVAVVCLMLSVLGFYRWGLSPAARFLADRIPEALSVELSQTTLDLLDEHLDLQPSSLPEARQSELKAGFRILAPDFAGELLLRSSDAIGANAMALPDGTIILFDALVALADQDDQVMAVLAHEIAHVTERHSMRLMLEGTIMAAFVAWWLGDISPILVGAPTALLQAQHSRKAETEADVVGMQIMCRAGIDPRALAEMLSRIEAHHAKRGAIPAAAQDEAEQGDSLELLEYLSSHPATGERVERLKRASADGCD